MRHTKIELERKINALKEAMTLKNVTRVAKKYGVSETTIYRSHNIIIGSIKEILEKKKSDSKICNEDDRVKSKWIRSKILSIKKWISRKEILERCPKCGSSQINKNGGYWIKNPLKVILYGRSALRDQRIPQYQCARCRAHIPSKEQVKNREMRRRIKLHIDRLIIYLRFKEALPIRSIIRIIKMAFGCYASAGYIWEVCDRTGQRAMKKLKCLSWTGQKVARLFMVDETFPKVKGRKGMGRAIHSMGVVLCEYGLIRAIKVIKNRKKDLMKLMKLPLGPAYDPDHFLSDYDHDYPKAITKAMGGKKVIILKDFVHTKKQITKMLKEETRKVSVQVPQNTPPKEKKKQQKLKRRLLKKHINRILRRLKKGFQNGYESVGNIYIEGGLEEIKRFAERFPSMEEFYKRLKKFVDKYLETWVYQMEHAEQFPTTTNSIESRNAWFSTFSKRFRYFENSEFLERHFCAVALMENYDIKERGVYAGTSAMQRAGVDLKEFGGMDFFEAVGLTEISSETKLSFKTEDAIEFALCNVA